MDQYSEFDQKIQKIINRVKKHPRSAGYNNNIPKVDALKKFGIWKLLTNERISHFFGEISRVFDIKRTDLYYWRKKLLENENWIPDHQKNAEISNVYTTKQFNGLKKMYDQIIDSKNMNLTDITMRKLSNRYYNNLEYHPQPNLQFNSSENYIEKIKDCFHYSTRMCHVKRRAAAGQDEIIAFIKRCRYVHTHSNKKQIVNVDESFCRTNQIYNFTCAHKGSDDIYINTSQGDKCGFTFVGTIGLDGSKYPIDRIWKNGCK